MGYVINGSTKTISLTSGTTLVSVRDMWSRWVDWFLTSDNSKYVPAFVQVGGNDIDISQGTKIPIYIYLVNGWRIKPQEANHTLNIHDGILLVDGGGDPFINTSGSFVVRVNYQQPVQAITVSTGGGSGGLSPQEQTMLLELYKIHGLELGTPVTVTQNSRQAGTINQTITGDGVNNSTISRD
jgi:hypothetical protein